MVVQLLIVLLFFAFLYACLIIHSVRYFIRTRLRFRLVALALSMVCLAAAIYVWWTTQYAGKNPAHTAEDDIHAAALICTYVWGFVSALIAASALRHSAARYKEQAEQSLESPGGSDGSVGQSDETRAYEK